MSKVKCDLLGRLTQEELDSAIDFVECFHCGVTAMELMRVGAALDVCGDEFCSDICSGERVFTAIALCRSCHCKNHQEEKNYRFS